VLGNGSTTNSLLQNGTATSTTVTGAATVTGLTDIDVGLLTIANGNNLTATLGVDMAAGTTLDLAGTVTGAVTNAGRLNVTDAAANITGSLVSTNELNLAGNTATPNDATTVLTVGGDVTLAGTVIVDAALAGPGNPTIVSSIAGANNLNGTVTLTLGNLDATAGGDFDNAVLFSNFTGTNNLTFSGFNFFPNAGALEYFVEDTGTNLLLRSRTSTAVSSVAATVGLAQTLVNTVVNRPTSPFVADLGAGAEEDPCGAGIWTRATGGTANADGSFTDVTAGLSGVAPVTLNYAGLQFGGDYACFGGAYNGWDLAFGAIAGFNDASSGSNSLNSAGVLEGIVDSDIFQQYFGAYVTAARGRFFADLQFRYEDTSFETTNTQVGGGLSSFSTEYDNKGQTLSGAVGYSWSAADNPGLTFVSSAGFSFSKNETDDVVLGPDGVLTYEDGFSRVGFLSASVASTTILPDEISLISYFGTATIYNDFADERRSTFTPTGGTPRDLLLDNLGAYGEVSLGVNYLKLLTPGQAGNARQFNASLRLDARFSGDMESYGLTGQMRLQF